MIEAAYLQDGLPVWTEDEAGPDQTLPYPKDYWHPAGQARRYPHEYVRAWTAKQLMLFHRAAGTVRVKGVRQATNATPHPWLREELSAFLDLLPLRPTRSVRTRTAASGNGIR